MRHAILRAVRHLAEGFTMGLANAIPGVSGGTMALILGIYEKLVGAMRDAVRAGMTLTRFDFREFVRLTRDLPWTFLGPLILGIIAAPLLAAGLLEELLLRYPEAMRGLFFGLIVGSIPVPWLRIRERRVSSWLLAVVAAGAAFFLAGLPPAEVGEPAIWQIFFASAIAVCAMILPGISGAYLLLVLGMYAPTLAALDALDMRFILVFGAGAACGLAAFAVLLNWLLRERHDATMAVLVGLMVGSLRALWPWLDGRSPRLPGPDQPVLTVLLLAGAGLAVTVLLARIDRKRGVEETHA